ncbi:MAG: RidA family protein [Gemmatimonadota bacterium]
MKTSIRTAAGLPAVLLAGGVAVACAPAERPAGERESRPPAVEYLTSEATASLGLPFSEAVRVGDLLFLSGHVGNLPGTFELAPGGIQGETRQALENIRRVLEANGSSLKRVVRCDVFLADISEWGAMNEVYVEFFSPDHLPARSALGASGLAIGARVEIECVATVEP